MEILKWKSIDEWKGHFPEVIKFQKINIELMPKELHNKLIVSVNCGEPDEKHYIRIMNYEEFRRNLVDCREAYQANKAAGNDIFYFNSVIKEELQNIQIKTVYFKDFSECIPSLIETSKNEPVMIPFAMAVIAFDEYEGREEQVGSSDSHIWLFKEYIYSSYSDESIPLSHEEEQLLIFEYYDKERRKWEKLKRLYGVKTETMNYPRERIPEEIRIAVWRRDGGKCAHCGSRERLEYDHIVPISKGGSNTVRNIELLCERCNREKSNEIR